MGSKIFLGGRGQDREGTDSVWDLASTFQAYDPVALLAALHAVRARFLRPMLINVKGTEGTAQHEILGMNEQNHGVRDGAALAEFLHQALLKGLTFPAEIRSPATARLLDILEFDPDLEEETKENAD